MIVGKKVLVLCPHPSEKGGVAHYYRLVKKYFVSNRMTVDFYYTGKNYRNKIQRNRFFKSLSDFLSLIKMFTYYDLIVLNPSLDLKAVIRDGIFNFTAKRIVRKKTLVFFRGWDTVFERIVDKYFKKMFKIFFCFDKALVLSNQFKNTLIRWGFDSENIGLETTAYEAREYDAAIDKDPFKLIFLSRLTEKKGGMEAIQTIRILVGEFPDLKLFVVGEGTLTHKLKKYVDRHRLNNNVIFSGWLEGDNKYSLLEKCGIMLYPTYYGEGMPNSLLEGMGFGLAVVTRPVAGIPAIVVDGKNGFLIGSLNPCDFAVKVKFLLQNRDVWQLISDRNKLEATKRFEIKNVVQRLEQLYFEIAQ